MSGKHTRREFLGIGGALSAGLGLGYLPRERRPGFLPGRDHLGRDVGAEADLVLLNGRVYQVTPDESNPVVEAFAVKNGRFVAVGSTHDVENLVGPNTEVVDATGQTVLPGFIDTHIHPAGVGDILYADLDVRTMDELLGRIEAQARETPPGQWVVGFKFDDTKLEDGPLTRWDLDRVVPDKPVRISHRGGHMGWYNTRALELAGVSRDIEDPPGGRYGRNADGELTGYVAGGAAQEVFQGIAENPEVTRDVRRRGITEKSKQMVAAGLVSVHEGNVGSVEQLRAYQDAYESGEMKFRVYLSCRLLPGPLPVPQKLVEAGLRSGFGDEWLRFGRVKFSLDGSASGRTMAMSTPYVGRPDDYGILYLDQEELNEGVEWAHRHGNQCEIHANGDVAIDMAMTAYERAERNWPRPGGESARHQIEHCSLVNPELLRRIADLGVMPSAFTTYIYYHSEKWAEYGEERMQWMFAKRSFLDHGIKVTAGSDYVPGPFEPLMGIQSMVTRTGYDGREWGLNQRISVEEAIRISTIHGAYASFEENLKGSIHTGKLADFVVLDDDPHEVDPFEILEIPVVRTVVDGKTEHLA